MADTSATSDGQVVRGHDLGDCWAVSVFVPNSMLRTLRGSEISGFEPNPNSPGRVRPVYSKNDAGQPIWLDKAFIVYVPKREGVYDLASAMPEGDQVARQGQQVKVVGNGDDAKIYRIGYGDAVEHFGGERLKPTVSASASTISND